MKALVPVDGAPGSAAVGVRDPLHGDRDWPRGSGSQPATTGMSYAPPGRRVPGQAAARPFAAPTDDSTLGRTAVVGAFPPRTRASLAQAEVLGRLQQLGLSHLFPEFTSLAPTTWMVQAFRNETQASAHSIGPLYCIRARSREVRTRTGLVARAVRLTNLHRERGGN